MNTKTRGLLSLLGMLVSAACAGPATEEAAKSAPAASSAAPAGTAQAEEPLPPPVYESALPEDMRSIVDVSFTGDFDEMVKRRVIRAAVPFNRSFYFVDKGVQRGLSYEYMQLFEEQLNQKMKTGNLKVHVVPIPMPRDVLLPALAAGKVDLVVAQLTVTPERQKIVDFTNPTRPNVNEVLVTTASEPTVAAAEDLSGKEVFVRKTSSYYASLQELNGTLKAKGKPAVNIQEASESLEDDDLLEMVNAGLIPATVVDDYLAEYWTQVFKDMKVQPA